MKPRISFILVCGFYYAGKHQVLAANEAGVQALESGRPGFEFGLNHFVTLGKILKGVKIAAEERRSIEVDTSYQ